MHTIYEISIFSHSKVMVKELSTCQGYRANDTHTMLEKDFQWWSMDTKCEVYIFNSSKLMVKVRVEKQRSKLYTNRQTNNLKQHNPIFFFCVCVCGGGGGGNKKVWFSIFFSSFYIFSRRETQNRFNLRNEIYIRSIL